jgi:hypothetical protein
VKTSLMKGLMLLHQGPVMDPHKSALNIPSTIQNSIEERVQAFTVRSIRRGRWVALERNVATVEFIWLEETSDK